MKKKAIEKVPYLTLPKVSRKKTVEYTGVTAFKDIAGERHLFVEVYRNDKAHKDIPAVRIVLNKKDFGTFFPQTGAWSRGRVVTATGGLVWMEDEGRTWKTKDTMEKGNALYSQEDLVRIKEFTKNSVWWDIKWWEYIERKQRDITGTEYREREVRRQERRQQALKERMDQIQELPEQRILEYADRIIFHELHYLYYKKHGVRAAVACSKCGGVSEGRWKPGVSYKSRFEKKIQEPRMGGYGTCPMCGAAGKYMPQGRVNGFDRQTAHVFLGQRYKENGMVFRYIEVEKEWQLQQVCTEKGTEMHSSQEKLDGIEIARAYFEPGKKIQKDFHKYNPYSGNDFWDDCSLGGLAKITVREAHVLPETYRDMKGTFLQYSAMEEFQKAAGVINPVDYLERYLQMPQIEMLAKMGMTSIVKELVKGRCGMVADSNADRMETFLGIRKERVKQLAEKEGDTGILKVMQMEKRLGQRWTDAQVEQLEEIGIDKTQAAMAAGHMTIQKLLNHISKYAGCGYGTMCGTAIGRLQAATQTYFDYLGMRQALGYDMGNTVYLFPRDLQTAHTKMVQEYNKQEADKRIKEAARKYPLIKKHYRRLRKEFYYEDENFLIRPARDAGEIVMEGRILHHCVSSDDYLAKHNNGESAILFLRTRKAPEMPYITVEINMQTLHIRQWYGAHNKKPDKEDMDRWLNIYETRLKCQRDGTPQEAAADGAARAAMPLLAYA